MRAPVLRVCVVLCGALVGAFVACSSAKDDGVTNVAHGSGSGCISDCGNNVVECFEQCDEGSDNSDNGDCTTGCEWAGCSDGFVHTTTTGNIGSGQAGPLE